MPQTKVSLLTKAARRDLFQDDLNEVVFMRPGQSLVSNLLNLDYLIIDGLVRAVGSVSITAGSKLRTLQNGYVRSYALMTVIGALALLTRYLGGDCMSLLTIIGLLPLIISILIIAIPNKNIGLIKKVTFASTTIIAVISILTSNRF